MIETAGKFGPSFRGFELHPKAKAKRWLLREAARMHPPSAKISDSEGTNVCL